ncbi:MAG: fasciclin domain-containing protein [Rhizonema sp. PD38]|nr:fasciclin domain-containing protein [Rhizonema sp. PD38]
MKVNYSNLLTKLASVVGVTGICLINLPTGASEVLNPHKSLFPMTNSSLRILANTQSLLGEPKLEAANPKAVSNIRLSQASGSRGVNPSPRILQECPYNRAACPQQPSNTAPTTSPTPDTTPSSPPVEVPVTPTPGSGTQTPSPTPGTPSPTPGTGNQGKNIVSLVQGNSQFSKLGQALKSAGLIDTLQGQGPFTVFAPTDAAFAKLPQDAVRDLFKPENKEVLVKILRYHVVQGRLSSRDLKSGELKSIEGGPINVKVDSGKGVMVNDAKVVQPDIKASNGVVHAIDNVILPPDL